MGNPVLFRYLVFECGFLTIIHIYLIFFFDLFAVYKKALTFATSIEITKKDKIMELHTTINLAVLHIIRVVVVASRA